MHDFHFCFDSLDRNLHVVTVTNKSAHATNLTRGFTCGIASFLIVLLPSCIDKYEENQVLWPVERLLLIK